MAEKVDGGWWRRCNFLFWKNLLRIKDIVSKEDAKGENGGEEVKVDTDVPPSRLKMDSKAEGATTAGKEKEVAGGKKEKEASS